MYFFFFYAATISSNPGPVSVSYFNLDAHLTTDYYLTKNTTSRSMTSFRLLTTLLTQASKEKLGSLPLPQSVNFVALGLTDIVQET